MPFGSLGRRRRIWSCPSGPGIAALDLCHRLFPKGGRGWRGSRRRVAVPGQKLRKRKRDGKKATDDRNGEHKKDHNDKLAARIGFPTAPMHFVRCATACLFTTDRNECSQKKTLRLDSQNWVQRHEGWRGPGVSPPPLGTEAFQRRTGGHFTLGGSR